MKSPCLFTILCYSLCSFGALKFTDEVFNRLDLKEIQSLPSRTASDELLIGYFEAEGLFLEGKIHASQDKLDQLLGKCASLLSAQAEPQIYLTCLLARLGFSSSRHSLDLFINNQHVNKAVRLIGRTDFSFEERCYLEGRLLWRLPKELGGSSGRSLVALESLYRIRPSLTAALFFMGQIYESEGNPRLAQRTYERALQADPPDPRAKMRMVDSDFDSEIGKSAPLSRFYFGVLSNPAGGTGFVLGKRDDRLWDTRRRLDAHVSAQSRGVLGARVDYEDSESLRPLDFKTRFVTFRERDQFFGLGPTTQLENLTEVLQSRTQLKFLVQKKWSAFNISSGLSWGIRYPSSFEGQTASSLLLDPMAAVALESEAMGAPFSGTQWVIRMGAAKKGVASTHDFTFLEVGAEQTLLEQWNQKISLRAFYRASSQNSPILNISQIGGSIGVPGIRFGRFRDYHLAVSTAEWQIPLGREFKFSVFGNLASLGAEASQILENKKLWGGGVALLVGTGSFQSRIEFGTFSGENLIQMGLQLSSL